MMGRFLAEFNLDRTSFWLGFLAGTLFWGLILILRPTLARLIGKIKARSAALREEIKTGTDVRLSNDTLNQTQKLHIAAPLFALDELIIEPRMLAPPIQVEPGIVVAPGDVINELLPYTPDWPEIAALYKAQTITLAQAFQEISRLLLIGKIGSGKTIALAHLASQIIRGLELPGELNKLTPVFVHAGDITLPPRNPENLLETLVDAIAIYASALTIPRLLPHLESIFKSGQAIIFLDGLDELPVENVNEIVSFIGELLSIYPSTYIVVAASIDYYDGLTSLDFAPIAIAAWDGNQRASFIRNWSELWLKYVGHNYTDAEAIDPLLLNAWLLQDDTPLNPLELTLKIWAAYAEDTLGPRPVNALEAYLRRMTVEIPNGKAALERLATGILTNQKPVFNQADAKPWLSGTIQLSQPDEPESFELEDQQTAENELTEESTGSISAGRVLPLLLDAGLIVKRQGGNFSLVHPQILGYLGGYTLHEPGAAMNWLERYRWPSATSAVGYFVIQQSKDDIVAAFIQKNNLPRMDALLTAATWLRDAPGSANWRTEVLRKIVTFLRDEDLPFGLRMRAGIALAASNVPNLDALYKQLFTSQSSELRLIATLTSGLIRSENLIESLVDLTQDISINVGRAACLALVAIGSQSALENIADILLHSEEDRRRAAAEALANHPEEGHPTLREGATLEDILVRRAVIFGLRRIRQSWAIETLETMQVEDAQWAVKNVAANALEEMKQPNPHLPRAFPPLTQTPWLIGFAGEKGIGVSPGKPARNLLIQALSDGTDEQKLAALDYLLRHAQEEDVLPVYQLMSTTEGEVRESAFNVLWHLSACGYTILYKAVD